MDKSYIAPLGSNGGGSRHRLPQVRKRTRGMNLASLVLATAPPSSSGLRRWTWTSCKSHAPPSHRHRITEHHSPGHRVPSETEAHSGGQDHSATPRTWIPVLATKPQALIPGAPPSGSSWKMRQRICSTTRRQVLARSGHATAPEIGRAHV